MTGELASETVNYDTKTMYQFEPKCNLLRSTLQVKQHFRSSRSYVFKNFINSTVKHVFESLGLQLY